MKNEKNRSNEKKSLFTHHEFKTWQALTATTASMLALCFFVFFCDIPNPNMILIAGLVICSSFFGFKGGIPAAVIMTTYTLFFFSNDHSFFSFTEKNLYKVIVSLFGIAVDMLFVCWLKKNENEAFREVKDLTEALKEENALLYEQSMIDELTGIGNRFALRRRFNEYASKELTVMMIDIDNFKLLNDDYGHLHGDKALKETSRTLSELFGVENCFRYGGDEFLAIIPEMEEKTRIEKIGILTRGKMETEEDGKKTTIGYSVGYVVGAARSQTELRALIDEADARMYNEKNIKKAAAK